MKFNKKNVSEACKNSFKYLTKRLSPYWITGFADAKSSFTIKMGKDINKKYFLRIIPEFFIELHEKDLSLLKQIQSFFGIGTVKLRTRAGKRTAIYSVQSLKNLTFIIIPHFKKYTLLTQKKADFELFCSIVDLMNKKEYLHFEGITKIISIRSSMNLGLSKALKTAFPNIVPVIRPIIQSQIINNPKWLVGFVDGEGCYYIKMKKNKSTVSQISLTFSISQHSRDSSLNIIKDFFECGIIENISTRPNSVNFVVRKLSDLSEKIIPFFEENYLLGTKLFDYQDFCKVAFLMKKKAHLKQDGFNQICRIKKGMNTGRNWK